MELFTYCMKLIFFCITTWLAEAYGEDTCGRCVKIEECPSFALLNKHEQQVWLEQVPCEWHQAIGETTTFGFPNENYVCCPSSSILDVNALDVEKSVTKTKRSLLANNIKTNNNIGRNIKQPYPIIQNLYGNQMSGTNKNYNDLNIPNDQNLLGGLFDTSIQQERNYGTEGNGFFNQGFNPNYFQNSLNLGNFWNNPGLPGAVQMDPGQNEDILQYPNKYPQQQQHPYYGNGNTNLVNKPKFDDQCAAQVLLPNPADNCCGQDMSDTEKVTDLINLLNIYGPSQNTPEQQQSWRLLHQNEKLSSKNSTGDVTLDNRIAGGKETELDQFPWTALLKVTFDNGNKQEMYSCGGSLISRQYVLTAGHCVFLQGYVVVKIEVTLAEYDKRTFPRDCKSELGQMPKCIDNILMNAADFILHPQYDDDSLQNDIAIIKLNGYAPYTRYIRPICLPTMNIDNGELSNLPLAVAGWGRNGPFVTDIKQSTVVYFVPRVECQKNYPHLTTSHLCAVGHTGEDTCKGDSGGPLMMMFGGSYYIVGVVSGKRADSPCGSAVPSVYTNVYQYVPWIQSIVIN